ncbi:MAG: cellulase family glycosylhydrolase, partial [Acutalibacteraceae bacterium]
MAGFKAQGMRIVDSHGRERIFNGINVCDKGHYDNETKKRTYSLEWTKGLAHKFKEHGFNLIRLGFTWDAVEPEPGKINEKYISFLKSVLDECEQEGIYVYLDMHQDLYSAAGIPVGDGAPGWATKPGKYEFQKTKLVWAEGYFWGRAVHQAFDSFWDNVKADGKGLQDWYAE